MNGAQRLEKASPEKTHDAGNICYRPVTRATRHSLDRGTGPGPTTGTTQNIELTTTAYELRNLCVKIEGILRDNHWLVIQEHGICAQQCEMSLHNGAFALAHATENQPRGFPQRMPRSGDRLLGLAQHVQLKDASYDIQ